MLYGNRNQSMIPNDYLESSNKEYKLIYQTDGNLVLYNAKGKALWSSGTAGQTAWKTYMQPDGNFVVYKAFHQPVWASNTEKHTNCKLVLEDNGSLVIYDENNMKLWSVLDSKSCGNAFYAEANSYLTPHDYLLSLNGKYMLLYQEDGDLVLYDEEGKALWSSKTKGQPAWRTYMQPDGNFVVYKGFHKPIWASNTENNPNSELVLGDDGGLAIFDIKGNKIWSKGNDNSNVNPIEREIADHYMFNRRELTLGHTLVVDYSSKTVGGKVSMKEVDTGGYAPGKNPFQHWEILPIDDQWFYLINQVSNLVLDYSSNDGLMCKPKPADYASNPNNYQLWSLEKCSNSPDFYIIHKQSGLVLDYSGDDLTCKKKDINTPNPGTNKYQHWCFSDSKSSHKPSPVLKSNWMNNIDDGKSIGDINIPGTHDSAAINTFSLSPWACHCYTITEQLNKGVRMLDIRISISLEKNKNYKFMTCHGSFGTNEFQTLDSLFGECQQFLKKNPSEAIIASLKVDDWNNVTKQQEALEKLIDLINKYPIITQPHLPAMGQVRGNIFLYNRINEDIKLGTPIHWEDNCTNWTSNGSPEYSVFVQDKYRDYTLFSLPSKESQKFSYVEKAFDEKGSGKYDVVWSFASATWGIKDLWGIYIINKIISYLGQEDSTTRPDKLGWILFDYPFNSFRNTAGYNPMTVVDLIISSNFGYTGFNHSFELTHPHVDSPQHNVQKE